jgi:hypothetical protein
MELTSGKERLGEVGSVDMEVVKVAGDSSSLDGQRGGDGTLGG